VTFQVHVTEVAWRDVEETEDYFIEEERADLIAPFRVDLMATLRFIGENPTLRSDQQRPGVRREHLGRFDYNVWFRVFEEIEHVEVIAVFHTARGDDTLDTRF